MMLSYSRNSGRILMTIQEKKNLKREIKIKTIEKRSQLSCKTDANALVAVIILRQSSNTKRAFL